MFPDFTGVLMNVIMSPLCWVLRPKQLNILNTNWCQCLPNPELRHFSILSSVIVLLNLDSAKNKHEKVIIILLFYHFLCHRMPTRLRCKQQLLFHIGLFPLSRKIMSCPRSQTSKNIWVFEHGTAHPLPQLYLFWPTLD